MATTMMGVRWHPVSLLATRFATTWKYGLRNHTFSCSSSRDTGPVLDPYLPDGNHPSSPTPTPSRYSYRYHKLPTNARKTVELRKLLGEKMNGGTFPTLANGTTFSLKIGHMTFPIPWQLCETWDLSGYAPSQRRLRVNVEASDGPHEHMFASKSIESDPAARIGIRAQFRDLEPAWLTYPAPCAVAFGNALADWLDDKTIDFDKHEWGADRYPFIGVESHLVSKSSWDSVFNNPDGRKVHASKGTTTESKWVLKASALKAFKSLQERTHDESESAVIDYALEHLDQHGYLPSGLFFRQAKKGEGLGLKLRPDAIENLQSRVRELD